MESVAFWSTLILKSDPSFEDLDIIRVFRFIMHHWRTLATCLFLSVGLMSIWLTFTPRKFTSTATFFVYSENGKSSGGLSSYASLLGVATPADVSSYIDPLFKSIRLRKHVVAAFSASSPARVPKAILQFDEKTRIFKASCTDQNPLLAQKVLTAYISGINSLNTELELSPKKELLTILDPPSLPRRFSHPKVVKSLTLSVVAGLFMGLLLPLLGLFWKALRED